MQKFSVLASPLPVAPSWKLGRIRVAEDGGGARPSPVSDVVLRRHLLRRCVVRRSAGNRAEQDFFALVSRAEQNFFALVLWAEQNFFALVSRAEHNFFALILMAEQKCFALVSRGEQNFFGPISVLGAFSIDSSVPPCKILAPQIHSISSATPNHCSANTFIKTR